MTIRRTASSQTLREEGDEGDDRDNGEFHDVDFWVVEICKLERISKDFRSGLNRAPTQYLYDLVG